MYVGLFGSVNLERKDIEAIANMFFELKDLQKTDYEAVYKAIDNCVDELE